MGKNQLIVIIWFTFFSGLLANETSNTILGGLSIGLPSTVNFDIGYNSNDYGFNLRGIFYSNKESNGPLNNGIQFDAYKKMGKISPFNHRLLFFTGYTDIKNSPAKRLVYTGVGYGLKWKNINLQPGIGYQIFSSNYDKLNDLFFIFNTGIELELFHF